MRKSTKLNTTTVRLTKETHKMLKIVAADQELGINELAEDLLRHALSEMIKSILVKY